MNTKHSHLAMGFIVVFLSVLSPSYLYAQSSTGGVSLQQVERRQATIDAQLSPSADGRIPSNIIKVPAPQPLAGKASICFTIQTLQLSTAEGNPLVYPLTVYVGQALKAEKLFYGVHSDSAFHLLQKKGQAPCLSVVTIQRLSTAIQNRLIEKGYITSRVLMPKQDLNRGVLNIVLAMGKVGEVRVEADNSIQTHANRATLYNAFPTAKGQVFNLRDIEQGLENMRRLPTVSAEMNILPSQTVHYSDVVVKWRQRDIPFRLNLSVDNSGSRSTGRYLGTMNISWDNPLRLNDIFYASYTHSLKSGVKKADRHGHTDKSKTDNYSLHYSLPLGYWLLKLNASHYYYDQVVAGLNHPYHYTGDSDQGILDLSRVLYRDSQHKITGRASWWLKSSKSYIDGAEIEVQRRHTGGWSASLLQRSYFRSGTLTSSIAYKRGTGAFGAIAAPEELFDEGTSRMRIWTMDFDWNMPFQLGHQSLNWESSFHGQWSQVRLTPQDKLSIGGRYSVRGFSGEKTLSAEHGWYLRDEIAWRYKGNHHFYWGLDVGRVSGSSSDALPGQVLAGTVLGLKGQFKYHGQWYYDLFAGSPIREPTGFKADSLVLGFNFSYTL
ncbi:MAG: ShlB/FhaC/HecB family hemolysin secretion/activation protein [Ostreibacterium sp.]